MSRLARARKTGARRAEQRSGGMRYQAAETLLWLALALQSSWGGMTLGEMMAYLKERERPAGRRTVERMRDAIARLCPDFECVDPRERPLRYRIRRSSGGLAGLAGITADDLVAITTAAKVLRRDNLVAQADALHLFAAKLKSRLEYDNKRTLELDVEGLAEAEGIACRAGPRVVVPPETIAKLREAILAFRRVEIRYRARGSGLESRQVVEPYAFVYGQRPYLLARNVSLDKFSYWALANILDIRQLPQSFEKIKGFSLDKYLARSFGVFQEEPVAVVWRFDAEVADDAATFRFHPTQKTRRLRDGRLEVRFTAGGLQEMAWHVATWGEHVEVIKPDALRKMLAHNLTLRRDP